VDDEGTAVNEHFAAGTSSPARVPANRPAAGPTGHRAAGACGSSWKTCLGDT